MHDRVIDKEAPIKQSGDVLGVRQPAQEPSHVVRPSAQSSFLSRIVGNQGLQRTPGAGSRNTLSGPRPDTAPKSIRSLERTRALQDEDEPAADNRLRQLDDAGAPARPAPAPAPAPAPTPAPAAASASMTISGAGATDYVDTAANSKKNVKYNVTWSGGAKEDYVIVQWVKGFVKDSSGTFFKAQLYGSAADINFADYQIDSVDADPAYWSDTTGRWHYNVDGPNKFSATDRPVSLGAAEGKGAKARLDFKTGVYKTSDVPLTTTGTISSTPLSPLVPWSYYVTIVDRGGYDHT